MKKLMSVVFAAALAGTAWAETSADVLIWDINTKEDKASYDGATRNFDTIKFWAIDSNKQETDLTQYTYIGPEYLLANNTEGLAGSGGKIAGDGTTSAGTFYTDMSAFKEGYTFMAELYLGEGGLHVYGGTVPRWYDRGSHAHAANVVAIHGCGGFRPYTRKVGSIPGGASQPLQHGLVDGA